MSGVVIGFYLLIMTPIIIYSSRKVKTFEDYALAGGNLHWVVISGTLLATSIGGGSMIGYVDAFYQYGIMYFWLILGSLAAQLVLVFGLAARIRRLHIYTIADIFAMRYGKGAQMLSGFINMFAGLAVGFSMLSSFSVLLGEYAGMGEGTARVIGAVFFALTATMGGLRGVAITDAVQAILILGGTAVMTVVSVLRVGGTEEFARLPEKFLHLTSPNIPWMLFGGMVFSAFCVNLVDQATVFQRIRAARSAKGAQKALLCSAILTTVCMGFVMLMGLSARAVMGDHIGENQVFAELVHWAPPVVGMVFVVAVIAAVMTTANSMYLSASMTFSHDLLRQFVPKITDKGMIVGSRVFVWAMAAVSYIVVTYQPNIMKWILTGYASMTCLVLPLYGGLMTKKATPASGKWSLALSIGGVLVWEGLGSPWDINSVFIAVILGLVGFVAGFFVKKGVTEEQLELVDHFLAKAKAKDVA